MAIYGRAAFDELDEEQEWQLPTDPRRIWTPEPAQDIESDEGKDFLFLHTPVSSLAQAAYSSTHLSINPILRAYVDAWDFHRPLLLGLDKLTAFVLPNAITAAITTSQRLLHLPLPEGEAACQPATLRRATDMLTEIAECFWYDTAKPLPTPSISVADGGSVDLFWELADLTLLLNISEEDDGATFFGRRRGESKLSGVLGRGDIEVRHLSAWLASARD